MPEINFQVHDKILLTGAGFTHNFGTPLAKQIATEIFNNASIQAQSRVKKLLMNNDDFEDIYDEVTKGNYEPDEKSAIIEAVRAVYDSIDATVRSWRHDREPRVNNYGITKLVSQFAPPPGSKAKSFFFTLNQDLFIERWCHPQSPTTLFYPGLMADPRTIGLRQDNTLAETDCLCVPTRAQIGTWGRKLRASNFFYVKLHGSSHWIDAQVSRKIVIGKAKEDAIHNEPILDWYLKIFREVLSIPNRKLLVIGYGFGDKHINNVIADAVRNFKLRFYVINPSFATVPEFGADLSSRHRGSEILDGLANLYPYTLSHMFPPGGDGRPSPTAKSLYENFFEIPHPR